MQRAVLAGQQSEPLKEMYSPLVISRIYERYDGRVFKVGNRVRHGHAAVGAIAKHRHCGAKLGQCPACGLRADGCGQLDELQSPAMMSRAGSVGEPARFEPTYLLRSRRRPPASRRSRNNGSPLWFRGKILPVGRIL
jgi:hypothetical protein